MESIELARTLWKWFPGRDDIFGVGRPDASRPGKYIYPQRKEQLQLRTLAKHLDGELTIGVYPIKDNRVKWFAVDFDGPKLGDEPFPIALADAREVQKSLETAGLFVYLERSRSGNGVHLWGFLSEWTLAADVIDAIKPVIGDRISLDRVYPLQRALDEGGSGNLICLPFQGEAYELGNGAFLDELDNPIPILEFFAGAKHNLRSVIEKLATSHRERGVTVRAAQNRGLPPAALRPAAPLKTGILKMVSKYGCQFMHHCWTRAENHQEVPEPAWYAALGQFTVFEHGEAAALVMSRSRMHEFDSKWHNQLANVPVGCAYIHENFPELACQGCPMTAPYRVAERTLTDLVVDAGVQVSKGEFDQDLVRIEKRDRGEWSSGIKLGVDEIDDYVRLRPGELTVIGAAPSMGKTALLVQSMVSLGQQEVPIIAVEAEMQQEPLHDRLLGHVAEIDTKALRGERLSGPLTQDEWQRLRAAAEHLKGLPVYENYNATSPAQVLDIVELTVFRHGIDPREPFVTAFDFLQFSEKALGEEEHEKVGRNIYEFKSLAKLLSQPVIVFSQVTRPTIGTEEAPDMSVFRGSGKIEIHANVGLVLWGEYVNGPEAPRKITIVKQTDGTVGVTMEFLLHQSYSKFRSRRQYAGITVPATGLLGEAETDDEGQLHY